MKLNLLRPAALVVRVAQSAKSGANLRVTAGGKIADTPFPVLPQDSRSGKEILIPLEAGPQVVCLENTGQDWVVLRDIGIPDAAMKLGGLAKASRDFALAWFYHRDNIERDNIEADVAQGSSGGNALIRGLASGRYRVTWWDTLAGKALKIETTLGDARGLKLQIPAVSRDIAVWAQKID